MTECSRCGDCCENIPLNTNKRLVREWLRNPELSDDNRANSEFILAHWRGGRRASKDGRTKGWTCDQFDSASRLCLAHDARPPLCRRFPWYDNEPTAEKLADLPRCSFWADVAVPVSPPSLRVAEPEEQVA